MTRLVARHAIPVLWLTLLMVPAHGLARPLRGFHEGPYLQVTAGARDASFDTNVADNARNGQDIEPTYGFLFGWNISDPFSIEMQSTYGTSGSGNLQQHLIDARFCGRYSLIRSPLTDFKSLRLLPFLDGGLKLQLNVLPNASGGPSDRVLQWGTGIATGGGLSAVFFHDAVYLSLRGGADILRRSEIEQTIGGRSVVVYEGGWGVDWTAGSAVGVHF